MRALFGFVFAACLAFEANAQTVHLDQATAPAGENVNLTAGAAATTTSAGGDVTATAGNGGATSGNGGSITLSAGTAAAADNGGAVNINAGSSVDGPSGAVNINSGFAGSTGSGGDVAITAGDGGSVSGQGGAVSITAGSGLAGDAGGGDITLTPGSKDGAGTAGRVIVDGDATVNGDADINGVVNGDSFQTTGGSKTSVDYGANAANIGWYFPGSGAVAYSKAGTSAWFFDFSGAVPQYTFPSTTLLAWCNTTSADCGAQDMFVSRCGNNCTQFGFTTGASAAISLKASSVATGVSNQAGALLTIQDSGGTGSGASGGYAIQVAAAGGSGTSQNAYSNALTIAGGTGLFALPKITTDSGHTTSTVCQDTTTHALYFGSGTVGICLGTSSARFKPYIADLDVGLKQIAALRPVRYRLDAAHGDPDKVLYGFTAEQGGAVIPELMGTDSEGRPNTFDYLGVVPVLVKAIQELQAKIDRLEKQK